jgi:hypothetical protein
LPDNTITIPVGVCVFTPAKKNASRTTAYPNYVHEILAHAGLCFMHLAEQDLVSRLPHVGVLVTVGEPDVDWAGSEAITQWVAGGGCWISVAGVCGLAGTLGVEVEKPQFTGWGIGVSTVGEGYARMTRHPVCGDTPAPLHFFNGVAVRAKGSTVLAGILDSHQRETERAAIVEHSVGSGHTILIACDLPGTVVRVQQGLGITRDGVSAPDFTAPLMDDVLKSGDGSVLDWHFDRRPVDGVPGLSGFLDPVADLWRDILLRSVFYLAGKRSLSVPVLWFYPRNLPALAHMSHDTDGNELKNADALLDLLEQGMITSTWCVILPGYDEDRMRRIVQAGHELATHYDSMTEGLEWSKAQFDRQYQELLQLFSGVEPVTNKNHYLRWEGDCELFDWCLAHGIELDQSKGASKPGEVGYNFGTCHPYFPVRMNGETIDVLEMATPTQDLEVFVPRPAFTSLLETALKRHGIVHVLFHPAHALKTPVAQSILGSIAEAKAAGVEWWTARDINAWERARRGMTWSNYSQTDGTVTVQSEHDLVDATILWQAHDSTGDQVVRWGFPFKVQHHTFESGCTETLSNK